MVFECTHTQPQAVSVCVCLCVCIALERVPLARSLLDARRVNSWRPTARLISNHDDFGSAGWRAGGLTVAAATVAHNTQHTASVGWCECE